MYDYGNCRLSIVIESGEKHDHVPGYDVEILIVDKYITLALVVCWKTCDGLDDISKIARCPKEERKVMFSSNETFVIHELQGTQSRDVAPKVLVLSEWGNKRSIADKRRCVDATPESKNSS
jgi:hypothetical protein